MRNLFLAILLSLFSLAFAGTNSFYQQTVTAGLGTVTLVNLSNPINIPDFIWVYPTGGTPVSLSQNLIFSSTGTALAYDITHVQLYWEAGAINLNGYTFTAFGYNVPQWLLNDNAILDFYFKGGTAILQGIARPDIGDTSSISGSSIIPNSIPWLKSFTVPATFAAGFTADSPVVINQLVLICDTCPKTPLATLANGRVGTICDMCDTLPLLKKRFWGTSGNTGLGGTQSFIGTTDTARFSIRTNNVESGYISSYCSNTFYGYQTANSIVSLAGNTGIGNEALKAATSGNLNTMLGSLSGYLITTGSNNTGIGQAALATNVTGSNNTAIGDGADVATSSTTYGTAIGYNAVASSNQIAFSPNDRSVSFPGFSSGYMYVLTDTSGTGQAVFMPSPGNNGTTYTPNTGDSVIISTAKNTVNPAGTIANYTLILPATAINWQVYEFSFLQAVSALHWSIRLNGGTVSAGVPTAAAQYATIKIYYNPTLSEWVLY